MANTVQATANAALDWQLPIVWIRVNVGYMIVETDDMAKEGGKVADVQALLSRFADAFSAFAQAELAVFMAARETELRAAGPSDLLVQALDFLSNTFSPWLRDLDSVVTDREKRPTDRALVLLHSLGGEILNAHAAFRKAVEQYRSQVAA